MSKQVLVADSSQISTWFECPQEWAYINIEKLIAIDKVKPGETLRPSDAIAAGSLGHKLLEIYYTSLGNGEPPATAAASALAFDPDSADVADSYEFPLDQTVRAKVKKRFQDYLMNYPADRDFRPARRRTPQILIDENDMPYDGYRFEPLIEKGFSYKLYESTTELYVLEGRIDFIGESADGTLLWMDHKWQLRGHQLYAKNIQFRNYALALNLNLAVVNYIRLHEKLQKDTFVRQPLSFSALETRHWKEELTHTFREIAKQQAAGNFPKNRNSCQGRWGYPCMFTPLCEEYNLQTRAAIAKRDFTERREWTPW